VTVMWRVLLDFVQEKQTVTK